MLFQGQKYMFTFTFMHLADGFIQSIYSGYNFCQYVCSLGIEPTTLYTANAMLYHWAKGTGTHLTPQNKDVRHMIHSEIILICWFGAQEHV